MNEYHRPDGASSAAPIGREAPHSVEAEEYLLSCCLLDGADVVSRCLEARIRPESFYLNAHGIIFERLLVLYNRQTPIDVSVVAEELKTAKQLDQIGGYPFLMQVSSRIPTTAQAGYFIDKVRELALLREIINAGTGAVEECYNFSGGIADLLEGIPAKFERIRSTNLPASAADREVRARILVRRFSLASPPPEPIPRFLINGRAVCTSGNITNLIAQAKAGKSALTGAMLAAAICAEFGNVDRDTLGVTATAPGKQRLVHLDTEQSPFDHYQHLLRSLKRAGVSASPDWLQSYGLAGFSADDLRRVLRLTLNDARDAGGVFAVIIDGTADLVNDVNDPTECNAFVAELQDLAIKHDCPIVNVVHENPGQDGGKMRGHLGSQLERKAESNLRLRKSEEVTVVFSEKMRRAPILEKDGPRFCWSDGDGMHVSCATATATRDDAKREKMRDMAEAVFAHIEKPAARYADLLRAIQAVRRVSASTSEDRFTDMKKLNVIAKDSLGFWRLNPVTP